MASAASIASTHEELPPNGAMPTPAASKTSDLLSPEQHLGSSPLLKDSGNRSLKYQNSKFRNSTSSFRLSKDLANIRWDGPELKEDDIIFKDQDGYTSSEEDTGNGSDADNEEADAGQPGSKDASDAAQYSTISKRADLILANAKKRLNLLEGNLGKARHSLVSPQAVSELRTQSSLSSYPSTDDEDRSIRLRPRINFAPSRRGRAPPPIRKTPSGHSRMYSDTSVPSPTGVSIKGSRSLDHLSNTETIPSPLHEGGEFEEPDEASEESPTLQEAAQIVEEEPELATAKPAVEQRRSIQAIRELYGANSPAPKSTQELRDQADELRSRIAFLHKRSQTNGLLGDDPAAERNDKLFQAQVDALQRSLEDQESVIEQLEAAEQERSQNLEDDPRGEWHQVLSRNENQGSGSEFSEDEYDEYDDGEVPDALADEDDDDNKSMHGAHEDREDAFDYEHFILHSGMVLPATTGSGSQSSARSQRTASTERGIGDADSAEEPAFPGTVESWEAFQQPNDSVASLTTMQSFETAAEMNDSSSDLGSDASDMQHEELLQTGRLQDPWPMPPAVNGDGQRAAFRDSQIPTPTAASFSKPSRTSGLQSDTSRRPVSAVVVSLMQRDNEGIETRSLDREDDKLIRSTAESLRSVCQELALQQTSARDMQALRERLEVARRILAGEL